MIESLPPFEKNHQCPKCGFQVGTPTAPVFLYKSASRAHVPNDGCEEHGNEEHLHVTCNVCKYSWGMNVAGIVEPLSASEIAVLREIVRQATAAEPPSET